MSRECAVCGKRSLKANKVSFSHKHHAHLQVPNLQTVKANMNGSIKTIKVCASCIKANKVQKSV